MDLTEEIVRAVYQAALDRDPESEDVIRSYLNAGLSVSAFIDGVKQSVEYQQRVRAQANIPNHYQRSFNVPEVFARYKDPSPISKNGYVTDFVGSVTNTRFWNHLTTDAARVEGLPTPSNFHAAEDEWAASLRALDFVKKRFVAIEVGAGWGPWLASCGVAVRRKGIKEFKLIAVEGDSKHVTKIRNHLPDNGFVGDEVVIHEAIAGPVSGTALFPISEEGADDWGIQPVFPSSEAEADEIIRTADFIDYRGMRFSQFAKMRSINLADAVAIEGIVDLVHIDIQGGELDFVRGQLDFLTARCRYLVIGTHARTIEGGLIDVLSRAGWLLEVEKPCMFHIEGSKHHISTDGTQGWLNPRLV